MTRHFRLAVASTLIVFVVGALLPTSAGADAATDSATGWLATQQQDTDNDFLGSFEVAGFAPFETPDAILAVAEHAQTGTTWSSNEAKAAVQALDADPGFPGGTPLEWADDFLSSSTPSAGIAAKFIALVAVPLDVSTRAFDPALDGSPVDLEAIMDAGERADHSYGAGALNATLYALLAHGVLGRPAPDDTIDYVRNVQQANGGFNFSGDASGTDLDVDTTALAVTALTANGVPAGDATVAAAMKFLADEHQASGAWQSFGADDPNSTAVALVGVAADGWDPATACWRSSSSSAAPATGFISPDTWLRSRQLTTGADNGRFASPNDTFGVSTFATSQAIQALQVGLHRSWLPTDRATLQPTAAFVDVPPCVWFSQGVGWMADNGVSRFTTGHFGPRSPITKAQVVALLWNTMGSPTGAPLHGFTDVPAHAYYNDALDWAVDEGIVSGLPNGTYQPKRAVNRARMAYLLWKMVGSPEGAPAHGFTDVPANAFYDDALDWAAANGIVKGLPNGRYLPRNDVTRAQAATMFFRVASTEPAWGDVTLPPTIQFTL